MKNLILLLAVYVSPLIIISQSQVVNEEIEIIDDFQSINLNSRYTVYLKQSNETKIEVRALKEYLDISEFKVEDGVLNIDIKREEKDKSIWEQIDDIKIAPKLDVYISMKDIESLSVNGKLVSENSISSKNLNLILSGSGTLELDVKGEYLSVNNAGGGLVKLKGYANKAEIEQSGYGKTEAFELDLKEANVKSTGSGDIEVNVSQNLEASVYGSGKIAFKGNTKEVTKKEYGSGKVDRTY